MGRNAMGAELVALAPPYVAGARLRKHFSNEFGRCRDAETGQTLFSAYCWCETATLLVPASLIRAGVTLRCGRDGCEAPSTSTVRAKVKAASAVSA